MTKISTIYAIGYRKRNKYNYQVFREEMRLVSVIKVSRSRQFPRRIIAYLTELLRNEIVLLPINQIIF
jgi:hypothetical protein